MERDSSHIKNTRDFRTYVLFLADEVATTTARSLEEYLRALWSLIERAQDQQATYALFGQLLYDAFLTEIPLFDEMMLQYENPPHLDEGENEDSFSILQQMICYQIADRGIDGSTLILPPTYDVLPRHFKRMGYLQR